MSNSFQDASVWPGPAPKPSAFKLHFQKRSALEAAVRGYVRWLITPKGLVFLALLTGAAVLAAWTVPFARLQFAVPLGVLIGLAVSIVLTARGLSLAQRRVADMEELGGSGSVYEESLGAISNDILAFASRDNPNSNIAQWLEDHRTAAAHQGSHVDALTSHPLLSALYTGGGSIGELTSVLTERHLAYRYLAHCSRIALYPSTSVGLPQGVSQFRAEPTLTLPSPPDDWSPGGTYWADFKAALVRGASWERMQADKAEEAKREELRAAECAELLAEAEAEANRLAKQEDEARRLKAEARCAVETFRGKLKVELQPLEERRELLHRVQGLIRDFPKQKGWGGVTRRLGEAMAVADTACDDADTAVKSANELLEPQDVEAAQERALSALKEAHVDFFLLLSHLWGAPLVATHMSVNVGQAVTRLAVLRYLDDLATNNTKWSHLWRSVDTSGRIWLHASDLRGNTERASQAFTCRIDIEHESDDASGISLELFVPCGIQGDQSFYSVEEREGYGRGHSSLVQTFKPRLHKLHSESQSMKRVLSVLEKKKTTLSDILEEWTENRSESTHTQVYESYQGWESTFRNATTDREQTPTAGTPGKTWENAETSETVKQAIDSVRNSDEETRKRTAAELNKRVEDKTKEYADEEQNMREWEKKNVREVSYEVTWRSVNIDFTKPGELLRQWRLSSAKDVDSWLPTLIARLEDPEGMLEAIGRVITEHRNAFNEIVESGALAYKRAVRRLALDESEFTHSLRHTVNMMGDPTLKAARGLDGIDENSFFGGTDDLSS